jgi:hypothetical protein
MGTLGCATTYAAAVHAQGGAKLWTRLDGITALDWGRVRDDFSTAQVTVAKTTAGADCCGRLGQTSSWGHELTIYRNGGLVWQGPIVKKTETRTEFVLDARDMIAWLDRRAINPVGLEHWAPTPLNTGAMIRGMILDGFPVADPTRNPGLTQYLDVRDTPGQTSTLDHNWKDTVFVGELVRELVAAGVDFYTVGRRIVLTSDREQLARHPLRLTDEHFMAELKVVENGLDAATRGLLVGGQPLDGAGAPIPNVSPIVGRSGGPVAFYGQIDKISTSPNTTSVAVANGIAAAMRSYGYPPPVDLIVPDGARLSPHAPVTIEQLLPGVVISVHLVGYCTPIAQDFRLTELDVTWRPGTDTEDTERVAVSLASGGPAREPVTP